MIGRWSDGSALVVFQVMCRCSVLVAVVMSGEVGCWFMCVGTLVGVFSFRMICSEFWRMSSMSVPRWSVRGECHESE